MSVWLPAAGGGVSMTPPLPCRECGGPRAGGETYRRNKIPICRECRPLLEMLGRWRQAWYHAKMRGNRLWIEQTQKQSLRWHRSLGGQVR